MTNDERIEKLKKILSQTKKDALEVVNSVDAGSQYQKHTSTYISSLALGSFVQDVARQLEIDIYG